MHLTTCPVCHSAIDLLSLVEDEASSELLGEVSKLESWLAPNVLLYIGLFKPGKSKLNNSRALKLLKETLALTSNSRLLLKACEATVLNIREARKTQKAKPFKDHAYLIRVIDSMAESTVTVNEGKSNLGHAVIKKQGHTTTKEEDAMAHAATLEKFNYKQ
ncbi:hypothetical protein [Cognaticolwellia mytili]|uniref:hypothetical protein n=1 Tax=Cognaticolwellia mytili TaxID=1888913 RepID=UPI000A17229E|nr:hypothetical protein [Cognaticolwellia mytili]